MGLQLKKQNADDKNINNPGKDVSMEKRYEDPWGNKDIEDDFFEIDVKAMDEQKKKKAVWKRRKVLGILFRSCIAAMLIAAVIIIRWYVLKTMNPEYKELADYIYDDEEQLSKELDTSLTETDEWIPELFWWITDMNIKVCSDDDIGVYYFDNRRMGIHINTDKYKLFNLQVGTGDKAALEETTYKYQDYFIVYDDIYDGGGTTYYYYNKDNNDCVGITQNDSTGFIEGITYINNYQYFASKLGNIVLTD